MVYAKVKTMRKQQYKARILTCRPENPVSSMSACSSPDASPDDAVCLLSTARSLDELKVTEWLAFKAPL